jgi:hypothetical protein
MRFRLGKLYLKVPWTNIKVRQAMNEAINREVLMAPKIVDEWPSLGRDGSAPGHTQRITACKQGKACN